MQQTHRGLSFPDHVDDAARPQMFPSPHPSLGRSDISTARHLLDRAVTHLEHLLADHGHLLAGRNVDGEGGRCVLRAWRWMSFVSQVECERMRIVVVQSFRAQEKELSEKEGAFHSFPRLRQLAGWRGSLLPSVKAGTVPRKEGAGHAFNTLFSWQQGNANREGARIAVKSTFSITTLLNSIFIELYHVQVQLYTSGDPTPPPKHPPQDFSSRRQPLPPPPRPQG